MSANSASQTLLSNEALCATRGTSPTKRVTSPITCSAEGSERIIELVMPTPKFVESYGSQHSGLVAGGLTRKFSDYESANQLQNCNIILFSNKKNATKFHQTECLATIQNTDH